MVKILIFLLGAFSALYSQAQPVVFINAGSRANYGNYQELIIYADGNSIFRQREVNGPVKDSSSFQLTKSQLDSFFMKADAVGFFSLQTKYDSGAADGAGIYISLNSAGRKHSVNIRNTDVAAINELVEWLNTILAAYNARIYYGQNLKQ